MWRCRGRNEPSARASPRRAALDMSPAPAKTAKPASVDDTRINLHTERRPRSHSTPRAARARRGRWASRLSPCGAVIVRLLRPPRCARHLWRARPPRPATPSAPALLHSVSAGLPHTPLASPPRRRAGARHPRPVDELVMHLTAPAEARGLARSEACRPPCCRLAPRVAWRAPLRLARPMAKITEVGRPAEVPPPCCCSTPEVSMFRFCTGPLSSLTIKPRTI